VAASTPVAHRDAKGTGTQLDALHEVGSRGVIEHRRLIAAHQPLPVLEPDHGKSVPPGQSFE
jgi:hypothetical protein